MSKRDVNDEQIMLKVSTPTNSSLSLFHGVQEKNIVGQRL